MVDLQEAMYEAEKDSPDSQISKNNTGDMDKPLDGFPVQKLPLSNIVADPTFQSRETIDEETVSEYAELINQGREFPPVVVFACDGSYLLVDGFHRLAAHALSGKKTITAEIHEGNRRDALLFSITANVSHGLRRTNEDKRRAVNLLLVDDEWKTWSSGYIASVCGVSDRFVDKLRKATPNASETTVRKMMKNGNETFINTKNIGVANQVPAKETVEGENLPARQAYLNELVDLQEIRKELKNAIKSLLRSFNEEADLEETKKLISTVNDCLTSYQAALNA